MRHQACWQLEDQILENVHYPKKDNLLYSLFWFSVIHYSKTKTIAVRIRQKKTTKVRAKAELNIKVKMYIYLLLLKGPKHLFSK